MSQRNTQEVSESAGGRATCVVDGTVAWNRFLETMFQIYFFFPYYAWAAWSSFYFPRQRPRTPVSKDTAATLVEYARAGRREDFLWLARASGVDREEVETFWRGVRNRLGLKD